MIIVPRLAFILGLAMLLSWGCGGSSGNGPADTGCADGACLDVVSDGNALEEMTDPGDPPDDSGTFDPGTHDKIDPPPDTGQCLGVDCPGGFGCECDFNSDCDSGWCVIVDAATGQKRCTQICFEDCPCDWGCQNVGMVGTDPLFLCMPMLEPLCNLECLKDTDCGLDNLCVLMETHQFCLQACGSGLEDCPEGYECAETTNWDETVTSEQCFPISGHCSCEPDVDYLTDEDHCGSCENKCDFDHGYADCQDGLCKLTGCEEGWINLNGIQDDGCEYECTFKGPDDPPDPLYLDDNCDGIDGNINIGVFVDGPKGDDDNLIGDMNHPFKTINAALDFADGSDPKREVYVSKGQYPEQVVLENGVSLYGGYDSAAAWKRDIDTHKTMILVDDQEPQAVRSVIAQQIVDTTVFDGFWVKTSGAVQPSASSYGVYVYQASSGLIISNNHIESGNGADGKGGSYGQNGGNGNDGGSGSNSFEYDGCGLCFTCNKMSSSEADALNKPGDGGGSPCGMKGGKGGKGGKQDNGGVAGVAAPNGGGAGGAAGASESDNGKPGGKGNDGNDGKHGEGGAAVGTLSPAGLLVGNGGGDGADGEHGFGGGGGGGGGGDSGAILGVDCDSMGGAGGGGSGAGCGGTGGHGGTAGGGSFAIFVVEASPTIMGNHLASGSGGNGGVGGQGGDGGYGGDGGGGGAKADDDTGVGGKGGDGGNAGSGGSGGGGAGGSTFGIYILGSSSNPDCSTDNAFQINGFAGSGGPGGAGPNKGESGLSGTIFGATPSCSSQ